MINIQTNNFRYTHYVYALICPVSNVVKYVGSTSNPEGRFLAHIHVSKSKKPFKTNRKLYTWIKELSSKNLIPKMKILKDESVDENLKDEMYFIKKYSSKELLNVQSIRHYEIDVKNLKKIKKERHMKYKDLAKIIGVTPAAVNVYFNNNSGLSLAKVQKLQSYLLKAGHHR